MRRMYGKDEAMSITTKELADLCGVSRGTVDRALNDKSGVSARTKAKIMEAAKTHGYIPNMPARSLARGKTDTVGIIVFDLRNEHFVELVHSVEEQFAEMGVTTYVCLSGKDPEKEKKLLLTLAARRVDGILLVSVNQGAAFRQFLEALGVPVVAVSNRVEGMAYVGGNNDGAIHAAMDWTAAKGIRRQYFVCPPIRREKEQNIGAQKERAEAYLAHMRAHSELCGQLIDDEDYWQRVRSVVQESSAPTAILCSSDHYALRIYKQAREAGYRLPEDFSLMGFDGSAILDDLPQRIHSIRYPADQIGSEAVRMLKQLWNGESACDVVLDCALLPGETMFGKSNA